jgi:NAD(P)-dependent dehydrogenase (short-subunit alcohol dehydrogenase family)
MVLFVAIVALANMGIGFALAIHLARQHRQLTGPGRRGQPVESVAAEPSVTGAGD